MPALRPDQSVANLKTLEINPIQEVTRITCLADAGTYEVSRFLFPATASAGQGDFVHIINKTGTKFAIWLDIDDNGTAPSGTVASAADHLIEVNIVTGDTNAQVAAKVKAAVELDGNWDEITISNTGGGTLTFTSDLLGNLTNAAAYAANEATSGSIGATLITAGVASNLQNKYFIMRNPAATVFNAWFNVSGEGVDPNPAGTEIACALTNGGTAAAIAAEIATAVNANANFKAWVQDDYLYVANEATGTAVDVSAGDSGFTITKIQDGKAGWFYPAMSPESLSVTPSAIS